MRFPILRAAALSALTLVACIPGAAHAQPMSFLVKGSGPTVYFNASSGKRYFFPNESVFKSWYMDYSTVAEVSDGQLASLPLAGNVTYRPGTVMVKITTDPRVYAVSRYGVLHWIPNETLAAQLYGADWNKKIVDVPDTFFTNYIIGYQLNTVTDFSPSQEMVMTQTPDDNIRTSNYLPPELPNNLPPNGNNPVLSLKISSSHAVQNQTVSVDVTVTSSTLPVAKIEINANGTSSPVQVCLNATNCTYSFVVQTAPLHTVYTATVYDMSGTKFTVPAGSEAVLDVSSASNQIQVGLSPQTVTVGGRVSYSSTITNPPVIQSHKVYAVIPGQTDAVLLKDCGTLNTCASSTPFYRTTYVYSQFTSGSQTYVSPEVLVMVTGGYAPRPTLTVAGHPQLNQVQLDVTAPFGEGIGFTTIVDGTKIDDRTLALCNSASCSIVIQVNVPGSVTAFTDVGGKEEPSNVVTVTPQ